MEEVQRSESPLTGRFPWACRLLQALNYENKSHLGTGSQFHTDVSAEGGIGNTPACCAPYSKTKGTNIWALGGTVLIHLGTQGIGLGIWLVLFIKKKIFF